MDQVVGFTEMEWTSGEDYIHPHPQMQKYEKHLGGQMSRERELHAASKASKDNSLDAVFSNVVFEDDQAHHATDAALSTVCSSIDEDMLAYLFPLDNLVDRTILSDTLIEIANNPGNARKQVAAWQILEPQDVAVVPDVIQASRSKPNLDSGQEKATNPTVQQLHKVAPLPRHSAELIPSSMSYSSASSSALQPQPPKCQHTFHSPDSVPEGSASGMNFACFSRPAALARANVHSPSMRYPTIEIHMPIEGREEVYQSAALPSDAVDSNRKQEQFYLASDAVDSSRKDLAQYLPSDALDSSRKQAQCQVHTSQIKGCMDADDLSNRTTDADSRNTDMKPGTTHIACGSISHGDKISSFSAAEAMDPSSTTSLGESPNTSKNSGKLAGKRKTIEAENPGDSKSILDVENNSREIQRPARGRSRRRRAAEVHNLSERRRRDRINEKMKALQKLIPSSNKTDKASMLDEAIEYLKMLQSQLQCAMQMMSVGNGMTIQVLVPAGQEQLQAPQIAQTPKIRNGPGLAMAMDMQLGLGRMGMASNGYRWHSSPLPFSVCPRNPMVPSFSVPDPHSPYLSPQVLEQYNAMANQQPLQPVNMDLLQAYFLSRPQSQSQSQQLHCQVQQPSSSSTLSKSVFRSS